MEYNVCATCGASDGRAGMLINDGTVSGDNCRNCTDSLRTGDIVVHAHLTRTVEELTRMGEAVKKRNEAKAIESEDLVRAMVDPRRDVAGRLLKVGQKVACNHSGYTYSLVIGEVVGFTPKKVRVEIRHGAKTYKETKFPSQLCIIK